MTEPVPVLAALDDIEGYRHDDPDKSLYTASEGRTSCCPTARSRQAWVYFYNAPLGRAPRIPSGDYLEHTRCESANDAGAVLAVLGRRCLMAGAGSRARRRIDPRIEKLVASVSEERLQQLLQKLSSFKTRNTCSDPTAPDGDRRGAAMDLRRTEAHEPEAAGQLRHAPGPDRPRLPRERSSCAT